MKGIAVRILGALVIVMALANLSGLLLPDVRELMISWPTVAVRYCLMLTFGVGLVMLRKWGAYLAIVALVFNWAAYFVVYGGESATTPIWVAVVVPLLLAGIIGLSWKSLK
jgi:hypothetical protein